MRWNHCTTPYIRPQPTCCKSGQSQQRQQKSRINNRNGYFQAHPLLRYCLTVPRPLALRLTHGRLGRLHWTPRNWATADDTPQIRPGFQRRQLSDRMGWSTNYQTSQTSARLGAPPNRTHRDESVFYTPPLSTTSQPAILSKNCWKSHNISIRRITAVLHCSLTARQCVMTQKGSMP